MRLMGSRRVLALCVAFALAGPVGGMLLDAQQLADSADGMTSLHSAARRGDVAAVAQLIKSGAALESTTRVGNYTPLHVASKEGHGSIVKAHLVCLRPFYS